MARPRSTDPKVPLTIRLPRSVTEVWQARADRAGRSLREHVEVKLTEAVEREAPRPASATAEPQPTVTPNFKGAK